MTDAINWIMDLMAPQIGTMLTGIMVIGTVIELVTFVRTLFKKVT